MIEHDEFATRVVPFSVRRHFIRELDLEPLLAAHARLRDMCNRLEEYADALPGRLPSADADAICCDLRVVVVSHARDETAVIDALFTRSIGDPLTAAVMRRVRARHISDAIQADDILAALSGVSTPCAEAFGYMLRSFFDGARQAMDFTQLAILTLGAGRLTQGSRDMLVRGLGERNAI
ncbi:hemerythrin domain-containing protein [Sphingomonas sp. PAMC26645]|uniref:hemerythrin domain-containing protein n=1 Tax=Sphingomonas sp. PAMC26645 TaxID=2565555 RepID=UPI0014472636|nr:hemerythrin domain-containing protein [Sphingomonas sp. PAMC26645]